MGSKPKTKENHSQTVQSINSRHAMKTKLGLFIAGMLLAAGWTCLGQPCITITTQPQNQTSGAGTTVTLAVEATGAEPLAYQWQQAFDLNNFLDRPEGTNRTLAITNVQFLDSGNYRVIITNAECMVTSEVARLSVVLPPPPIPTAAQPTNFAVVSLGASVTNIVRVSGSQLSYQWRFNGTNIVGQTKLTIILTNLHLSDAGDYDVVLANMAGSVTSRVATLKVDPTYTQITTGPIPNDSEGGTLANWIDYDQDGLLDLYVARDGLYPPLIYHNNGDGSFTRIRTGVLAQTAASSWGTMWADYDNDGRVDLFVPNTTTMNDMLFHSEGNGNFTRILTGDPVRDGRDSNGAIWTDYDRDGFVDLFVTTYSSQDDLFYRNNRDGSFRKLAAADLGPIVADAASTEFIIAVDVDNDGIQELSRTITTGRGSTNQLWTSDQGGKYIPMDVGGMSGSIQYGGITWADYDNDGFQDGLTGVTGAPFRLFRNLQGKGFTNVTASAGLPAVNALLSVWVDYDNDGWIDFLALMGDTANHYVLCRNNGDGTFTTNDIGSPLRGYFSLVPGDYDNDGFQDLFGTSSAGVRCGLFRNNGNTNHWLKILLDGRASNRSGIGAKVWAQATIKGKTLWQLREISAQGFGLDNGLIAHFGLGDATNVTTLRIEWPSGVVQELQNVPANQFLTVVEHQDYPGAAPQLGEVTNSVGGLKLGIAEPDAGTRYILEASTNLVNWTKLMARTSAGGTAQFTDARATNYARRFYRLQVP